MGRVFTTLRRLLDGCLDALSSRFARWSKPLVTSLPLTTLTDLGRSKSELIAENALLRQQLIILRRQVKRPACPKMDRMLLVLLARLARTWKQTLFIVQPETLLRGPRELFAFFLVELKSRKVIHVGVTRSPTDAWVAQHLREATPYRQAPKYLIRDNDNKFGSCFARVARTSGIKILMTPYHAPRANAICERFLRSARQECLDHLLIVQEKQHEPRA